MAAVLTVGVDDDADWCAERRLLAGRVEQADTTLSYSNVIINYGGIHWSP